MKHSTLILIGGALACVALSAAYADAPVVDYSTSVANVAATSNAPATQTTATTFNASNQQQNSATAAAAIAAPSLSLDQRVVRLEQQINYINQNSSQTQIEDLQQKVQKLNGDLAVAQHNIADLEKQLHDFYADVDARLAKQKTSAATASKTSKSRAAATSSVSSDAVSNVSNDNADNQISVTSDDATTTSDQTAAPKSPHKNAKQQKIAAAKKLKNSKKPMRAASSATLDSIGGASNAIAQPATTASKAIATTPTDANANPADSDANSNAATVTADERIKTEQDAYKAAFDYLRNKQFNAGAQKLKAYLAAYPHGTYSGNAHYWLGEIYFLNNAYAKADTEFSTVVNNYHASPKIADASFKLAYIHDKQGKHAQAQKEYLAVTTRFPGTPAAKLAAQQLPQTPVS